MKQSTPLGSHTLNCTFLQFFVGQALCLYCCMHLCMYVQYVVMNCLVLGMRCGALKLHLAVVCMHVRTDKVRQVHGEGG